MEGSPLKMLLSIANTRWQFALCPKTATWDVNRSTGEIGIQRWRSGCYRIWTIWKCRDCTLLCIRRLTRRSQGLTLACCLFITPLTWFGSLLVRTQDCSCLAAIRHLRSFGIYFEKHGRRSGRFGASAGPAARPGKRIAINTANFWQLGGALQECVQQDQN